MTETTGEQTTEVTEPVQEVNLLDAEPVEEQQFEGPPVNDGIGPMLNEELGDDLIIMDTADDSPAAFDASNAEQLPTDGICAS